MDIFFTDPNDAPLPPAEVHIRELKAEIWPDGKRVAVRFTISPFLKRPNIELQIQDLEGEELAELNVVEVRETTMDFTMHLRKISSVGKYKLKIRVFYSELDQIDESNIETKSAGEILNDVAFTSDESEISFGVSDSESSD